MNQNAQLRRVSVDGRPSRSHLPDIAPKLDRRWFEFDRGAVLRQIDLVQDTIAENGNDLGMVAVEGVFDKSVSNELLRASRSLHAIAQELNALRSLVVQATDYPEGDRKLT